MESTPALQGGGLARRVFRSSSLAPLALAVGLTAGGLAACNLGQGEERVQSGTPGSEGDKPDGSGTFFVDENESGEASRLRIAEMFWGRLVDVYDAHQDPESNWVAGTTAFFADFVINETFRADSDEDSFAAGYGNFLMDSNPVTLKTRLVIRRVKGEPEPSPGAGTFLDLLHSTTQSMPPIDPKNDDGSSLEPFSFIARNSVLVIRVNDLLDDSAQAAEDLLENVHVLTGYRPTIPFGARVVFDGNHGGIAGGAFHSTRILVDMTTSEVEAADMPAAPGVNVIGLPASLTTTGQPNTSVRIPSQADFGSGQFTILRSLSGKPMATSSNGPVDWGSPTLDIVRAMRAGNAEDTSNGFMLDEDPPRLLGGWQFSVLAAYVDPDGLAGRDFVFDIDFATACMTAPREGDILALGGGYFLEVREDGVDPDPITGQVGSVRVHLLVGDDVTNLNAFLGLGIYMASFGEGATVDDSCWVTFTPLPTSLPGYPVVVSPDAQMMVRFSEPMDPDSVSPFDTIFVVRGDSSTVRTASNIVVGSTQASTNLKDFNFTGLLPFAHEGDPGDPSPYYVEILTGAAGVGDLAGNQIADAIPKVEFVIDPAAGPEENGGLVLRFAAADEYDFDLGDATSPDGLTDLRGQMYYDLAREVIHPRPVQRASYPVDYTNTLVSNFAPIPGGVLTPLVPLGSKLMALWRYADLEMNVRDDLKFNLDVEGLNWAPPGGQLVADYFEQFEIRLSPSIQLPDETVGLIGPVYPNSGLYSAPARFDSNIVSVPTDQVTVHHRALGYRINPVDLFLSSSGSLMMPYPLNLAGGERVDFTWRNTADLGTGGFSGSGVPQDIEVPGMDPGPVASIAPAGQVPTIGLPLLMEYRCYPSDDGIGLNSLSVGQAIVGYNIPTFRVFSSGGIDSSYNQIAKNPDLEDVPDGGFNPASTPPGQPTPPGDNLLYIGQLDTVIRVSRVHTVWFAAGVSSPDYLPPVVFPDPDAQPEGTVALLEYRGAAGFSGAGESVYDGTKLDPYGDLAPGVAGSVTFYGDGLWYDDVDQYDGAPYLQVRITFLSNIDTLRYAELDGLGLAWAAE
ncbi:MAG: Ig-like domain-containing protein [Planctomycetota bacterium]